MNWLCGDAWRMSDHWGFWFRIFGYGIAVSTMQPLFSERNGLARNTARVFGVKLEWLKPAKAG